MSDIPPFRPDPLASGYQPGSGAPDPTDDDHVSFPDDEVAAPSTPPVAPSPPVAPAGTMPSWTQPQQPPAAGYPSEQTYPGQPIGGQQPNAGQPPFGPGQQTWPGQPAPEAPTVTRSGCSAGVGKIAGVIAAVVLLLALALGVLGSVLASDDDKKAREPEASTPVTISTLPISPTPVPTLTPGVTSVRFEIQGAGRANVRIYRNGDTKKLSDVTLPFAFSLPLAGERSPYVSVTATDYERQDAMRCTAWAGDEVVAVSVGTRSVECTVTSASLPKAGDD